MQQQKASGYILAWALWALSSALGVLVAFWAVRDAIGALAEALTLAALQGTSAERFQVPLVRNAVDRFGVLFLGVLCVLLVVVVEHLYRTGFEEGQLLRRFVLVSLLESGVLFVALAIQVVFMAALGLFTAWSVLLPLAALALAVGLSWLLTRLPKRSSAG